MIRRILTWLDPAGYRTAYAHERLERERAECETENAVRNGLTLLHRVQQLERQKEELLRENRRLRELQRPMFGVAETGYEVN